MTNTQHFRFFPDPRLVLRQTSRVIPAVVRNKIMQITLNRLFGHALAAGELAFLNNRSVRISVSDINIDMAIMGTEKTLAVSAPDNHEHVTLRADSDALLAIITNQSDPDTLFFNRRLALEGDTELGLHLKNYLDTCEPELLLPKPMYHALAYSCQARQANRTT
jgi:predicted lipid carrier protein YhbT